MKTLLLALMVCFTMAGCVAYPAYGHVHGRTYIYEHNHHYNPYADVPYHPSHGYKYRPYYDQYGERRYYR